MSRATAIINKLNHALTSMNVTDRVVSKRVLIASGGDALLGRGVQVVTQDTMLNPQPAVVVAAKDYPLVVAGQEMSPDAEYLMTVSVTAMSRAEVTNPNLIITFTNVDGTVEELFIVGFEAGYLQGTDIAFSLVLASKKRST